MVLLVWVLVAFFCFYLSYDYIRVSMNDSKLDEYIHYVVQLSGEQSRPPKEVRELIIRRADELRLPVRSENITVLGVGKSLKVSVVYDVDIELPVVSRGVYRKLFQHKAAWQIPGG